MLNLTPSGIKLTLTGVKINTNLVWTSHNTGGVEFNTGVFAVWARRLVMGFPNGVDVGFQWVTDGLFYLGFNWVSSKGDHMGFMRATHMWVCIGYANVGPTRALCGLLNWICNGFPTRAPYWLPMWAWSWYLSFIGF